MTMVMEMDVGMVAHQDMFEASGITSIPKTLKELVDTAKKLTKSTNGKIKVMLHTISFERLLPALAMAQNDKSLILEEQNQ